MTMTAAGVAKLIEECGELQSELGQLVQVLGKRLAYWDADDHWDGSNLRERMQDEMGDVSAAILFVSHRLGLDRLAIDRRVDAKLALFNTWQDQLDNNDHGIDATTNGMTDELRDALLAWRRTVAPLEVGPDRKNPRRDLMDAVDAWRNSGRVFG